jgi:hypothetical protein
MLGLGAAGAGELTLPGLDEPTCAPQYVRMILTGARSQGWTFDRAWSAAVNRLQPSPQLGVAVDDAIVTELREERSLIEDCRPLWHAAYEDREPTARERAEVTVAAWRRWDDPAGFVNPIAKQAA